MVTVVRATYLPTYNVRQHLTSLLAQTTRKLVAINL